MKYPLATTTWDDKEYAAIRRVVSTGKFTMGSEVRKFEDQFAHKFGVAHAVMSNSGSSANLLAVSAIKYSSFAPGEGRNEVIVPAVSWGTTYYPLTQMGYRLKFVDVDVNTLNAGVEAIEMNIDSRTAGIMVVNLLGNPSELIPIRELADSHNLFMIEDNCESLGASYQGQFAGTVGDIGTFSSFYSHHISTMEGGISVTNSEELRQVMTSLRAHGWTRDLPETNFVHNKTGDPFEDLFRFVLPGFNLRPIEIEGAIGLEQIAKLDQIVSGRKANALKFKEMMSKYPDISTQKETGNSSWFGFSMILTGALQGRRSELIQELNASGVAVRPIVAGNFTRNPVLAHLPHVELPNLPVADQVHDNGLFVGNHHYEMNDEFLVLEKAINNFLA